MLPDSFALWVVGVAGAGRGEVNASDAPGLMRLADLAGGGMLALSKRFLDEVSMGREMDLPPFS